MTDRRKAIGRKGEALAASYLQKQGYQIIDRNWMSRLGELDLVVWKANQLIICEVRSTTQTYFGYGFQSINGKKRQKLYRLANLYIKHKNLTNINIRIDVISVLLDRQGSLLDLKHIEGI